ncbi:unnamed protein product [Phyllotreta striolata]|uniref:Tetraspanin n=1 Tax=Phyllotreta striolata TaxID=444603 RepID=A0A9N9U0C1_PHYSR|nr:unnamed protein product [Phyllotreta striolata]
MASLKWKKAFCIAYSGFLFFTGVLLIVFSAILLYRIFHHYDFITSSTTGPLIFLIILGNLHLILTWLGVKATTREHNFHIYLFMFFTLMLLVSEFTIGVWSMVLWDSVGVPSTDLLTQVFNGVLKEEIYSKSWSQVQSDLQCCGLHGPQDYELYPKEGAVQLSYLSCKNNEVTNPNGEIVPYKDGCEDVFVGYVEFILIESAIMGFLAAIFQGFGLFVLVSFYRTLREERTRRSARMSELQRQLSVQSQEMLPPVAVHQPVLEAQPGVATPLHPDTPTHPPSYAPNETEKV